MRAVERRAGKSTQGGSPSRDPLGLFDGGAQAPPSGPGGGAPRLLSAAGARLDGGGGVVRFRGRDVVRVVMPDGSAQPFYRSTGTNSKQAGRWFPFDGVRRTPQGLWFDKGRFASGAAGVAHGRELSTPEDLGEWLASPRHSPGGAPRKTPDAPLPEMLDDLAPGSKQFRDAQFSDPKPSALTRAGRAAADVINLPKALRASIDLSAVGRQGLPQLLAHPTRLRSVMRKQVRAAVSAEEYYEAFARSVAERPDFKLISESGFFLASVEDFKPRGLREEVYSSGFSQEIPGVAASGRAFNVALDTLRVAAWDTYTKELAGQPHVTRDTYRAIAELINVSTGRGVVPVLDRSKLGKKIVNLLNLPFFSPRNMASRFNLVSPYRLARNAVNPATRPVAAIQMKEGFRAAATLGTTLFLLDNVPGVDVGWNPARHDFGKVRVGNATYDLTGGMSYTLRYLSRMAGAFHSLSQGKELEGKDTPSALTARYLRSQLSPSAALAVDWKTGETFGGEAFEWKDAPAALAVPFSVASAYERWLAAGGSSAGELADSVRRGDYDGLETGFSGALMSAPGVVGAGVRFEGVGDARRREREFRRGRLGVRRTLLTRRVAASAPEGVREEVARLRFQVPPLPRTVSTEGLTGDRVQARSGEQLASFSDEEFKALERRYADEVSKAISEVVSNPDYRSFRYDYQRSAYLAHAAKSVQQRVLNEARLQLRGRQTRKLEELEEYQRKLERRGKRVKPGVPVKL